MHDFFFENYEIPRPNAARALCASFLPVKFTVHSGESVNGEALTDYYSSGYELKTPKQRARAARARARNTRFTDFIQHPAVHLAPGPRNFDKLVITAVDAPAARSHRCVCMLLQISQNTKGAGSV